MKEKINEKRTYCPSYAYFVILIMRKLILFITSLLFLASCTTYKPIVDTAGRSGTYNEDKAKEITNDLQHCKQIARENTNLLSNFSFWFMSPTS